MFVITTVDIKSCNTFSLLIIFIYYPYQSRSTVLYVCFPLLAPYLEVCSFFSVLPVLETPCTFSVSVLPTSLRLLFTLRVQYSAITHIGVLGVGAAFGDYMCQKEDRHSWAAERASQMSGRPRFPQHETEAGTVSACLAFPPPPPNSLLLCLEPPPLAGWFSFLFWNSQLKRVWEASQKHVPTGPGAS